MMKKVFRRIFVSALFFLPLLPGCVTPTPSARLESPALPKTNAKAVIGSVSNVSGKTFDIDIEQKLHNALRKSLENEGIYVSDLSKSTDFKINVNITRYEPGNAFKRWLVPWIWKHHFNGSRRTAECPRRHRSWARY